MIITILNNVAMKVGVNALMLISICTAETNLKVINNISDPNGGSMGVCQVALRTAREISPHLDALSLQMIDVNALVAAKYLKRLSKRYKGDELIAAYNSGTPRYNEYGMLLNNKYVAKVNNIWYNIEKE